MTRIPALLLCSLAACAARPAPQTVPAISTIQLAAHRVQMIQWLHEYAVAEVFPTDGNGLPQSVFRDVQGHRCPMAELIHRSGRDDLVDAVVHDNNAVRLADVHDGPLHDWMLSSGLTMDEIAMVQGAMSFEQERQIQDLMLVSAAARGEVRGKLATAEVALRNDTAHSVSVAAAALPEGKLVSNPVRGRVVPAPKTARR